MQMRSPNEISRIEQQVMAAVATTYTVRQLLSATALKLYVCVFALFAVARLVWVERVFENFSRVGFGHAAEFVFAAIAHTDVLVQLSLAVLVLAGISLLRDLVRSSQGSSYAF